MFYLYPISSNIRQYKSLARVDVSYFHNLKTIYMYTNTKIRKTYLYNVCPCYVIWFSFWSNVQI